MFSRSLILLIMLCLGHETTASFRTNFRIKRMELCNNTQGSFKFHGNITREGDEYYVTAKVLFPVPLDERIGCSCKIETKVGGTYVELFTIRENNTCKAANMYVGEMWYAIERAAQKIPGMCPVREGFFEVHHALLDFRKMSLQTFPFGEMRFTTKLVDIRHIICCV